jgi:hypothetical protein
MSNVGILADWAESVVVLGHPGLRIAEFCGREK